MAKKQKKYFSREKDISKFLFSTLILIVFGSIFGQSFYTQIIKQVDDFVLVAYGYGGGGNDYNNDPPPSPTPIPVISPTPLPEPIPLPTPVPPVAEIHACPTLINIYPGVVNVGGSDFALTINGLYFTPESVVKINNLSRETQYISSEELSVLVTEQDIKIVGILKITVYNPPSLDVKGMTSNVKTLKINNPTPTIESIYPVSMIRGNFDFDLIIDGIGFISSSIITVDDSLKLPTTYNSSTQLQGVFPGSATKELKNYNISVINPEPGGGISNIKKLTILDRTLPINTPRNLDIKYILVVLLVIISTTLFIIERRT